MTNPIPLKYRLFKKYKGCIKNKPDWRDITHQDLLGSGAYVPDPNCPSWQQGFDNELKYGKLDRDNQGHGLNCTWEGTSKYLEMLNLIETKNYTDLSGKGWYPLYRLSQGGGYIRDAVNYAVSIGCPEESYIPSYMAGHALPTEAFMETLVDSPDIRANSAIYKSKKFVYLPTSSTLTDIDWENVRQVIWQFGGFVSGYNGHCMYCSSYGLIGGKKAIKFVNSYGEGTDRWWVEGEAYPIYDITYLIDLPNPPSKIFMLNIILDTKTNRQYLVGKDGSYSWIYDEAVLEFLNSAGIVDKTKLILDNNLDLTKVKETIALIK